MANVCCTCASIVTFDAVYTDVSEKGVHNKRLDCCGRLVCAECIVKNPRFGTYCPFCQTPTPLSSASNAPPSYLDSLSAQDTTRTPSIYRDPLQHTSDEPPPYDGEAPVRDEKHPDVVHYLSPEDSMTSLSLSYKVPMNALRQLNNIWSDHLLSARKILLIPGAYYQGPSLAPDPIEDEEESQRKSKIRRLMTSCKIHEYDVAVLYLEQQSWNFEAALEKYQADEQWEKEHPLKGKQKGVEQRNIGRRLATRW